MKRKILVLILCISILCACLSSCSRQPPAAKSVLSRLLQTEIDLPSGQVYLSSSPEGDKSYIPDSLVASLYGGGSMPREYDDWVEFAIFLSSSHPCEFAVFLCDSPQSALDTSKTLCSRLTTLKNFWSDSQYSFYTENAEVIISGNFCVLVVSSDTTTAKKMLKTLI